MAQHILNNVMVGLVTDLVKGGQRIQITYNQTQDRYIIGYFFTYTMDTKANVTNTSRNYMQKFSPNVDVAYFGEMGKAYISGNRATIEPILQTILNDGFRVIEDPDESLDLCISCKLKQPLLKDRITGLKFCSKECFHVLGI